MSPGQGFVLSKINTSAWKSHVSVYSRDGHAVISSGSESSGNQGTAGKARTDTEGKRHH